MRAPLLLLLLPFAAIGSEPAADGPAALLQRAQAGDAAAQYDLAQRYGRGDGVAVDHEAAATWLRRAAEAGQADAQFAWGTMLSQHGKEAGDRAAARQWFERAAGQGHAMASAQLGISAMDAGDKAGAATHFQHAAEHGDAEMQFAYAVMLANGELGEPDPTQAEHWLRRAGEGSHVQARERLGLAYLSGEGVVQHVRAGYFWLLLAGDNLGERGRRGLSVVEETLDQAELDLLRARATAWKPGVPSMPYVSGALAYRPRPADPSMPLRPLERLDLADAIALPDPGADPIRTRVLLSPWLLPVDTTVRQWSDALRRHEGVLLGLDDNNKVIAVELLIAGSASALDPVHLDARLQRDAGSVRGRIRTLDRHDPAVIGAWMDLQFAVPLPPVADSD